MVNYRIRGALLQDGHAFTRPPYFNGQCYSYQKNRFTIFVQSNDFQAWVVIKKGPKLIPGHKEKSKDKDKESSSFDIEDLESFEVTKEQQEVIQTNACAISLLLCAVTGEEYNKISICETTKEMWEKLEVTYEGTSKVKK